MLAAGFDTVAEDDGVAGRAVIGGATVGPGPSVGSEPPQPAMRTVIRAAVLIERVRVCDMAISPGETPGGASPSTMGRAPEKLSDRALDLDVTRIPGMANQVRLGRPSLVSQWPRTGRRPGRARPARPRPGRRSRRTPRCGCRPRFSRMR